MGIKYIAKSVALLGILSVLGTTIVLGHSWYPPKCCSDQDCHPVECETIVEKQDGYYYHGDRANEVYPSEDKQCHACVTSWGKTLCVFIQNNV